MLLRLDEQFRRDHLAPTLGILLFSSAAMVFAPRHAPAAEILSVAFFIVTGIYFIHQFGIRGGPLAIGFLAICVLVGVIGIPWRHGLALAAAGVLSAGILAVYSAWIQNLQIEQDHRLSVEAELASDVASSTSDVEGLKQKLEKQEARLKTWASMVDVVRGCSSTLKLDQLSGFVLAALESLFPEDRVSVWITAAASPPTSDVPSPAGTSGRRYQRRAFEPASADGLDRLAIDRQQNILVVDQEKDHRFQSAGEFRFLGRSALVCPLIEENKVYGNLRVTSLMPERFSHEDMVILSHIAGVLSMSTSNVRLYERTEELALTDAQTGLFKRYHFEKRFEEECKRSRRKGVSLAMVLLDIDHFKRVNDTYGHVVGDRVLQRVGRTVRDVDWAGPLPCRWGGEEFLVVLPDATAAQARRRAEDLSKKIKSLPFSTSDKAAGPEGDKTPENFFVTVSIGVATFPVDTGDPAQLFQICDRRLYAAKNSGRDRIVGDD